MYTVQTIHHTYRLAYSSTVHTCVPVRESEAAMEALLAAQSGDFTKFREVIAKLPENGMIVDNNGYSIAHWSAYYDDIDIFQLQVEAYPQQIAMITNGGLSPLHISALCNSKRILRYILRHKPGIIDLRTRFGETALHLAASVGNCDIVQELVDAGANCESADQWQRTPYQVYVLCSMKTVYYECPI